MSKMFRRHLDPKVREALKDTPVVVLTGARQTGKSTLARGLIGPAFPAEYVTLDNLAARSAAQSDAHGFLAGHRGPLVIDEVQHAPLLFTAIKEAVDADRKPGAFLLTGSANVLLLPQIAESLAGRAQRFTLWPISQGELAGRLDRFVEAVFTTRPLALKGSGDVRRDGLRRALRGGFPEALSRPTRARRADWFGSYVESLLERDVRSLARIERLAELPDLLALVAARSSTLLNESELSRTLGLVVKTLSRYLTLLERLYLVSRIPAWSGDLGRRVVKHPKIVISDSGLMSHLQKVDLARYDVDPTLAGPLLETFVLCELMRQMGWCSEQTSLYHFRTQAGEEVDAVLERRDGLLVGIEVKARSTVDGHDFKGLRALAEAAGKKFVRGVVLYTGAKTVPFAANLHAVPINALWEL